MPSAIQGIYVVVDPYNTATDGRPLLDAAAQIGSSSPSCATAEPFCTRTNGILLNVDWCRFEGYPNAMLTKDFSCHYFLKVNPSAVPPTATQTLPVTEDTHSCPVAMGKMTSYDECAGSDMATALADIVAINAIRSAAGRPALRISLGLMAGIATPETYLMQSTISYQSIPFMPNGSAPLCAAEPQVWLSPYVTAYLRAYDEFISYVSNNVGPSQIKLVKVTPLAATTLEYDLPGQAATIPTAADPNTPDDDDVIANCAGNPSVGAQVWINAFTAARGGLGMDSVIQGMENTFGRIVGNLYATLANEGALNGNTVFGLSLATNNANALPQINCGMTPGSGTGAMHTCTPQSYTQDQYSLYYLFQDVADLFPSAGTTTVANTAAQNASMALGQTFALGLTQFFVNTTQLMDPTPNCTGGTPPYCPTVSTGTLSCNLNEVASNPSADQGSFLLGSPSSPATPVTGVGTQIGVQTMIGLTDPSKNPEGVDACTATGAQGLKAILAYAISNGAQYIEITPDIAGDDAECGAAIKYELNQIVGQTQTNCLYAM